MIPYINTRRARARKSAELRRREDRSPSPPHDAALVRESRGAAAAAGPSSSPTRPPISPLSSPPTADRQPLPTTMPSTPPAMYPVHRAYSAPAPPVRAGQTASTLLPHPREGEASSASSSDIIPLADSSVVDDPHGARLQRVSNRLSALRAVSSFGSGSPHIDWASSSLGAEPGIDPEKAQFKDMNGPANVQIIDWSAERVQKRSFGAADFVQWFLHQGGSQRPAWSKCRWINMDGLQWSVVREVALHFKLHPLALEDGIKFASHSHSKADWYADQLFVRLLVHSVCPSPLNPVPEGEKRRHSGPVQTALKSLGLDRSSRYARDVLNGDTENIGAFTDEPEHSRQDDDDDGYLLADGDKNGSQSGDEFQDERLEEQLAAKAVVNHLSAKFRVQVDRQQMSMFLLPQGTFISIFTHSGQLLTESIVERIRTPGTMLRSSEDASMLLQAMLDVAVDECIEITEEFRRELDILEGRALINPDIAAVRHLHVLSGQLLMLKRTLTPVQSLLNGLRHHDIERTRAARNYTKSTLTVDTARMEGYLSPTAKLYLNDVNDHIESVLSSLELFSQMADNIVDFIFNSLSFANNESMKWLTFITIIFLPLTFISGIFGMNFAIFPEIGLFPEGTEPYGPNQNGDIAYFWKICGPLTAALIGLIFIATFGTSVVSWGRRILHRIEKHKNRKVIRGIRRSKTRRKQA